MFIHRILEMTSAVAGLTFAAALNPVPSHSDSTAYLVNVTARPGYHFTGPDDALRSGYELCDAINAGTPYTALIGKVKSDQQTSDEYQAAYLINQAVNELCPAQIWTLRQTAAGHQPRSGSS